MKKALILGTNAGQADIIRYLKNEGWEVHACGYKREGPGCDLADQFHLVNTIDVDAVTDLAQSINPDVVYSVSSDSAIKSVTKVSERLGLPHYLNSEIIDLFDKKESLRNFLNSNNISRVEYTTIKDLDQTVCWNIFPCVVKPSDSQGQRGVVLIYNKADFKSAVANAIKWSNTQTAIVEEYLEGTEFSTHLVIQNYKIIVNEFTERYVHGVKYFGLPKGHGIPVRNITNEHLEQARTMVEKMVEKLNVKDAILYVQMVDTKNGPRIIEVAPRLDGCHIWRLLSISRGYDLRRYAIDGLLGTEIHHHPIDKGAYSLFFYQQPFGTPFKRDDWKDMDQVEFQEFRYNDGEEIVRINGRLEVVGYYVKKD